MAGRRKPPRLHPRGFRPRRPNQKRPSFRLALSTRLASAYISRAGMAKTQYKFNISEGAIMRYLHTMLRVRNLDAALDFYCNKLGLTEVRRRVDDKNKYTLVFLAASADGDLVANGPGNRQAPLVEQTYNWDSEDNGEARYFGHLAYEVDDIYALCDRLMKAGVTINRPPRDGMMAFVRSPDKHSIELLQKGEALPPKEPWTSMPNTGKW